MNENDSEHMAGLLLEAGAEEALSAEESDIIVINTCAVRAKSVDKVYSLLGRMKRIKQASPDVQIAVTGCVAQIYHDEIRKRYPFVDLIVGPDNYPALPEMLGKRRIRTEAATGWHSGWQEIRGGYRAKGISGFVTIMEGCNNFCSYCVVPFTRGREKFRPAAQILEEIEELAAKGYREVQLLGQNVNVYRDPDHGTGFPVLLRELGRIRGIAWIRFITSHPRDFSREMGLAMKEVPQVCRQLHLPIQAGSDSVLRAMNRGYTRSEYMDRIGMLRSLMPDIALSTDIIVGFPGESEQDFEDTLRVLEEVRFTNIFSFRYSPRPRTAASRTLPDSVPLEDKKRRLMRVQSLQKQIQLEMHRDLTSRSVEVLCMGPSKKDGSVYSGRNAANQVVNFIALRDPTGTFVRVKITEYGPYSLKGELPE
jgi:tRNA-2-methylthio-N6-dimethylallyladenosine synthase